MASNDIKRRECQCHSVILAYMQGNGYCGCAADRELVKPGGGWEIAW